MAVRGKAELGKGAWLKDTGLALIPVAGLAVYAALKFLQTPSSLAFAIVLPVLLAVVMTAVFHAEDLAHALGEPAGTLVLTIAVTVIEVALILPVAFGSHGDPALARDTVFAVVMIVCNGLVGLCILTGGIRHREQDFQVTGASAYLAVLSALSVLTLILPNYTTSTPGPAFAPSQLLLVAVETLLLYGVFLYIQTIRHTEYFVLPEAQPQPSAAQGRFPVKQLLLLLATLLAAVLLAKTFAGLLKAELAAAGAPGALAGFVVALLVLLPESIAALRASYANQIQRSINLALGSSLATIGLTVPAVAALSLYLGRDLILGLGNQSAVLLLLTLLLSTLTFGTGRTNILYGFVHLIVFATYILLIFSP
jgi:Ca2+:H+ antiporter